MRIVAVTRILNEADIVEAFARHHSHYVQHHVFLDNGSRDGTLDILKALQAEGLPLSVLQNRAVSFNEEPFNTTLYRIAAHDLGADWVLVLDTDEFLDDRKLPGGLGAYLDALPAELGCVKLRLTHYRATTADDMGQRIVPLRLTHREERSDVEKVIVRGRGLAHRRVILASGGHEVFLDRGQPCPSVPEERLTHAHYPERSVFQYFSKNIVGWAKVLAGGEACLSRGFSTHYRAPFSILRDDPGALLRNAEFMQFRHEAGRLVSDPLPYKGGALRYTPETDEAMRAVRVILAYLDDLATQHGRLLDTCPEAILRVAGWNARIDRLL